MKIAAWKFIRNRDGKTVYAIDHFDLAIGNGCVVWIHEEGSRLETMSLAMWQAKMEAHHPRRVELDLSEIACK